ncbi:MAG: hypothetical protein J7K00_03640 [Candidatus Diapherotrites archaeon]|nr:hypothetical protein [Candidatus Diapherotrites archaeon]
MKIAISTEKKTMDSLVDQRFGRCKYFLIMELENGNPVNVKAVENLGALQGHGAGIQASQQLGELGIEAVITGNLGPNATEVLNQLGIKAYAASGTAKDAVEKFSQGTLGKINKTAEPHAGMGFQTQKESEDKTSEKIFFPLLDDNGTDSKISPHFGHAPFFGLFDTGTKKLTITENTLTHTDPNKSPVDQIIEAVNPTIVFAQGIGGRAIALFNEKGISLKTGPYTTAGEAINNLDKLSKLTTDCGQGVFD